MILYIKCTCGRNKTLAAKMQKQGYDVRITSKKVEWRREAEAYRTRLPFTVVDGKVTEL